MALIQLGGGVTDIRGSIGGTTFTRSRAGSIARRRTKPVNPRSHLQNARRARIASLTKHWSAVLTEQERTDWRAYAAGTSWTNKLGQSIEINGLAAFLRVNALVLLYSSTIITAAPLGMGHAGGVTITFDAESDTGKIQLDEPGGSFDKDIDGHFLMLFAGLPTEPGRVTIPKGMRYMTHVAGNSVAPQAFPFEMTSPYTIAEGQLVTVRAMFIDEKYRASGPFFYSEAAAPSV